MDAVAPSSVAELHACFPGPFVRTRLVAGAVRHVWRLGDAVVVEQSRDRHGRPVTAPHLVCLGGAGDLRRLLAVVAPRLWAWPSRVSVEAHAHAALPCDWRLDGPSRWSAMWTAEPPAPVPGEDAVDDVDAVDDEAEVQALLDVANPGSHGRPGDPLVRRWVGVRERGRLVAAGALATVATAEVAHLRGVSTLPGERGRGLGTAVSARLTRLGLASIPARGPREPLVTLGVYTGNGPAVSVYRRLGYRHDRSFVSGPLR